VFHLARDATNTKCRSNVGCPDTGIVSGRLAAYETGETGVTQSNHSGPKTHPAAARFDLQDHRGNIYTPISDCDPFLRAQRDGRLPTAARDMDDHLGGLPGR
jgi:hypothetical protein